MTIKLELVEIPLPDFCEKKSMVYLTCWYRWHWWQTWKPIRDPRTKVPELFETAEEVEARLSSMGFEPK